MTSIEFIQKSKPDTNFFNGFAVGLMVQGVAEKLSDIDYSGFHEWMIDICSFIEGKDVNFISDNQLKADGIVINISDSAYTLYLMYDVVDFESQYRLQEEEFGVINSASMDELPF